MPSPKTWDLLGACETCLQAITIANGYYTDAGGYVTREPAQVPDTQQALIVVALDTLQRAEEPALREVGRLANILVIGKVATSQDDAQLRLHELIDDIQRSFEKRHDVFPVGTQFPRFLDAQVIPPVDGMKWIGASVRFAAHVRMR